MAATIATAPAIVAVAAVLGMIFLPARRSSHARFTDQAASLSVDLMRVNQTAGQRGGF
jgi:hypothetical protein